MFSLLSVTGPIGSVGPGDILKALQPIWVAKHDTARRVKHRLGVIFDWAKGAGHYHHENPTNGLVKSLPNVRPKTAHMAAMPWQLLPDFFSELDAKEGVSARALEFIILTASRSGEVRGARWAEIQGDIWTIPPERMKTHRQHRVPLSRNALKVLDRVRGLDDHLIFPSPSRLANGQSRQMSDMVFKALMIRMKRGGVTTHGFRSTFRDWCSESAGADREVAEAALSHILGNKVERAYARSDLFTRRKTLMESWSTYVRKDHEQVLQLVRA